MTSHLEAPNGTPDAVVVAWAEYSSIIGLARLDKVNGGLDAIGFLHESDRAKAIVEAAVRAQIDEDVRALVEASAAAMSALDRAEVVSGFYEESSSIRFYCPECEAEAGWRSNGTLKAAHEAGCELAATVSSLRAALEPFKAVSPTGSEEVNGNG